MATNWTAVTTPETFLQIANSNTGGWFWISMLFMIFAVSLISMLPMGFEAALLGAAFAALMLGIPLAYMGLVAWGWVLMYSGIIILMFLVIMYSKKN